MSKHNRVKNTISGSCFLGTTAPNQCGKKQTIYLILLSGESFFCGLVLSVLSDFWGYKNCPIVYRIHIMLFR